MIKADYDIAIIGAGPAGLTAAIYASRAGRRVIVLEKQLIGGTVSTIDRIDNYPGFAMGIDGLTLAASFANQAKRCGAEIQFETVTGIEVDGGVVWLRRESGAPISARACLVTTGSTYHKLNIPGEKRFAHYCATCDGPLFLGKDIVTIGGANTAVQEVLYLSNIARHTTMLVRSHIKAEAILRQKLDKAIAMGRVTLCEGWHPIEFVPAASDRVTVKAASSTGENKIIDTDGVFVFAGAMPETGFLKDSGIELDDAGWIMTNDSYETSLSRVYAAGDVCSGRPRQIATAVGDGAAAAMAIDTLLRTGD